MLVNPMPGSDRGAILRILFEQKCQAENARSNQAGSVVVASPYLQWATNAARLLRNQVRSTDIEALVLTRRYWLIQELSVRDKGIDISGMFRPLIEMELEERILEFDAAHRALDRQIRRWERPGWFIVADTSVYMESEPLERLDVGAALGSRGEPVHLLIPMIVIDELDALKGKGDGNRRGRARTSLAVIDRLLPDPNSIGRLREEDFSAIQSQGIPRGEITVEIVFDPIRHARMSINDDELIDRTLAIQALAGRQVCFLTHDTGQSMRARAAGLKVIKLPPRDSSPGT